MTLDHALYQSVALHIIDMLYICNRLNLPFKNFLILLNKRKTKGTTVVIARNGMKNQIKNVSIAFSILENDHFHLEENVIFVRYCLKHQ